MVNWITVMFGAAVGQLVRWGRAIVTVATIVARSMGSMIKRVGLALFSASALPLMRQQLPDSAIQLRRQSGEHILEVGKRVVPTAAPTPPPVVNYFCAALHSTPDLPPQAQS